MAILDFDEYVRAVIAYTERLCDDIGLLRGMLKILIEEDGNGVTEEQNHRLIAPDTEDDRSDGRGNVGEGLP